MKNIKALPYYPIQIQALCSPLSGVPLNLMLRLHHRLHSILLLPLYTEVLVSTLYFCCLSLVTSFLIEHNGTQQLLIVLPAMAGHLWTTADSATNYRSVEWSELFVH